MFFFFVWCFRFCLPLQPLKGRNVRLGLSVVDSPFTFVHLPFLIHVFFFFFSTLLTLQHHHLRSTNPPHVLVCVQLCFSFNSWLSVFLGLCICVARYVLPECPYNCLMLPLATAHDLALHCCNQCPCWSWNLALLCSMWKIVLHLKKGCKYFMNSLLQESNT